ncbi:hypothetical protein [Bacillus sp. FJAT-22090]|uniref:hypothetical protein n=1 Tax=Bacillus sp. FJAT-22090 TaxID=1581038 RepID=UPI0011A3485C|nr:hypothetical protein [Bacillus sp. FJAT-22090]
MKKLNFLVSILLLTFLLGACGTDNDNANPSTTTDDSVNTETTNQAEGETESVTYPKEELKGTATESETQGYTITVIDGFELTAEEPNKDLLFNQENDLQSMRIETFSKDEANLEDTTKNLVDTLQASNDNETVVELEEQEQIPSSESIKNVKAYQINTPDGIVYGYTFENEGLVVKLTVFDTNESPAIKQFVDMASTIHEK